MLHREIGCRLMFLLLLRRNRLQRSANPGLHPGQLPIVEALLCRPGCTQQELADELRVTPASVALSTKRLEKAGLVEKRADENDRRRNRLYATEEGRQLAASRRRCFDELDAAMLHGLTSEELCTLRALLDRLIENLGASADDGLPMPPREWKENNE